MKTATFFLSAAALLVIPFIASAAEPWVAPASARNRANAYANNASAVAAGKKLFVANCISCHGPTGKGDGPAAVALNPKPANFSDSKVSRQADGELFWKISEGRGAMVPWKGSLNETQRWQLVNYIRSIAPKN